MVANTLQPTLPWMASHAEDRRFRQILLQVLALCLVIGGIIPTIEVPLVEPEVTVELPPRLVRIVDDRKTPAAPPPAKRRPKAAQAEVSQPAVEKAVTMPPEAKAPAPQAKKIPEAKPRSAQAKPSATPRQQAAQAGLLAMSDALGELRNSVPAAATAGSGSRTAPSGASRKSGKSSRLAADITQGSTGIADAGVAHQSVLGAAGLPSRKVSSVQGLGTGTPGGAGTQGGGGSQDRASGAMRSEQEIQEILDRNKSAMYRIYNRELRRDSTLQGKLVLSITIAPSGRVVRCTVVDSELEAASLEEQLIRLIKDIDFGNKPEVPVVTTKVPIEFFPL
jgi:outer membrane biosynthesis protein TonB